MIDITFLIASFAGGVFGAALGGLPVFILCGVAAMIGAGITMATGDATFSNLVAWGPFLGPQVSFAGGAAAAVYAAKKGKLASGRDIASGLMGLDAPDVLFVGGLFGALGYLLQWALNMVPNIGGSPWTNTIALSIVINAIIARLVFGKTGVFGKVRAGDNRWVPSDVAAWLPWQSRPAQLILIAIGAGLVISYITSLIPASAGLGFGIVVSALIFLQYGTKVPVTHHIVLSAELATAATGNIWWGLAFALLAAFLGEIYACLFLNHGDSHIDPPSATLATTFTIQSVLAAVGVMALGGFIPLIVAIVIGALGYVGMTALRAPRVRGMAAAAD
ncbi:MAG TPA: hypothetical protein VLT88_01900 [Desulfosarcina sp.]|nr:hypothetical protein [Desulfosarcina sp.]